MTDGVRQKLCDLVAAYGEGVADDPRRCEELLRQSVPEGGDGVDTLLRALEARVPARLTLLTEPLAPLTAALVRRLVDEQGLTEEAARWAVESWAVALGKSKNGELAPGPFAGYEHLLKSPPRRRRALWLVLPILVVLAGVGAWFWLGQRSEVRRLSGRTSGIYELALANDGRTVFLACADSSLRLWEVATGAELKRFDGHQGPISDVALSPDAKRALSAGGTRQIRDGAKIVTNDCVVRAWDLETGLPLGPFGTYYKFTDAVQEALRKPLRDAELVQLQAALDKLKPLKDKKYEDEKAFLGELARRLTPAELAHYQDALVNDCRVSDYPVPIYCVAFSPDGKLALAGMGDYEYKEGKYVLKDDKPLPFDCVICLYDAATGHEIRRLEGHRAPVWCAAFTPDGKRVVSGSIDGTIRLWDVASGQELHRVEQAGKPRVTCLAVSPDNRRVLTGDNQGVLRLWSLDNLELLQEEKRSAEALRSVAFSPDGRRALSGGEDFLVRLWDADTLAELAHYPGHTAAVRGVAFFPDGKQGLSGSLDGTIRIWRLKP